MDREELQALAEADQRLAFVSDMFPPFLKRYYDNCLAVGWDEPNAIYWTTEILKSVVELI